MATAAEGPHYLWTGTDFELQPEYFPEGRPVPGDRVDTRHENTDVDTRALPPVYFTAPDLALVFRAIDSNEHLQTDWRFMRAWANPELGFQVWIDTASVRQVHRTIAVSTLGIGHEVAGTQSSGMIIDVDSSNDTTLPPIRELLAAQDQSSQKWIPVVREGGEIDARFALLYLGSKRGASPRSPFPQQLQERFRHCFERTPSLLARLVGAANTPSLAYSASLVSYFKLSRSQKEVPFAMFWFTCWLACVISDQGRALQDPWGYYHMSLASWNGNAVGRVPPPLWAWRDLAEDVGVLVSTSNRQPETRPEDEWDDLGDEQRYHTRARHALRRGQQPRIY